MDPQTAWNDLVFCARAVLSDKAAPGAGDVEAMCELIDNLNDWLLKGGYAPKGLV